MPFPRFKVWRMASDKSCFRLERLCHSLHEPGHTVLVEPVSFTFDTIDLDSMIVCGLTALPHELEHESDARRRLLRGPR